ncbi:MAG: hypothetical protein ACNI3C_03985 [Candidatus Marinarcus sp.]|uniref:hypothetical protein n=1 Tax=Candidatus Marinarcus sp. TaxID=3100987 RepID=UPI003B00B9CD
MSSISDTVNEFNIGFFTITNNRENPIDFKIPKNSEFADFNKSLQVVSSESYEPPLETRYLEGFDATDPKHPVPIQIPITGHFKKSFLDKDGNWDEVAEYAFYRDRELKYKEEVISDWMVARGFDLQNNADLMKALLGKVG